MKVKFIKNPGNLIEKKKPIVITKEEFREDPKKYMGIKNNTVRIMNKDQKSSLTMCGPAYLHPEIGMTRENLQELLGEPNFIGGVSSEYPKGYILLYRSPLTNGNDIEYHFDLKKPEKTSQLHCIRKFEAR